MILRIRKDRTAIHSVLYPIAFEFKKNGNREIYYFESSYFANHDELCHGTGECWLTSENQNDNLSYSYKKLIKDNKDTIHVSLKEFNNHFKYLIDNFYEGDSIYLHFHDHNRRIDVP